MPSSSKALPAISYNKENENFSEEKNLEVNITGNKEIDKQLVGFYDEIFTEINEQIKIIELNSSNIEESLKFAILETSLRIATEKAITAEQAMKPIEVLLIKLQAMNLITIKIKEKSKGFGKSSLPEEDIEDLLKENIDSELFLSYEGSAKEKISEDIQKKIKEYLQLLKEKLS